MPPAVVYKAGQKIGTITKGCKTFVVQIVTKTDGWYRPTGWPTQQVRDDMMKHVSRPDFQPHPDAEIIDIAYVRMRRITGTEGLTSCSEPPHPSKSDPRVHISVMELDKQGKEVAKSHVPVEPPQSSAQDVKVKHPRKVVEMGKGDQGDKDK